jgi:hypothetical protein
LAQRAAEKFEEVAVAANLESKVGEEFLCSAKCTHLSAVAIDDSTIGALVTREAAKKYFSILVS